MSQHRGSDMTTSDPDDNTSVPSRPVKATPEQLRIKLTSLTNFAARQARLYAEGKPLDPESVTDKENEILALFATFLASIELPEKIDNRQQSEINGVEDVISDELVEYEYNAGWNAHADQSQAIIDKLIEELQNGG